jgi:hypothetical protein
MAAVESDDGGPDWEFRATVIFRLTFVTFRGPEAPPGTRSAIVADPAGPFSSRKASGRVKISSFSGKGASI